MILSSLMRYTVIHPMTLALYLNDLTSILENSLILPNGEILIFNNTGNIMRFTILNLNAQNVSYIIDSGSYILGTSTNYAFYIEDKLHLTYRGLNMINFYLEQFLIR
jgi:hypothetical protein